MARQTTLGQSPFFVCSHLRAVALVQEDVQARGHVGDVGYDVLEVVAQRVSKRVSVVKWQCPWLRRRRRDRGLLTVHMVAQRSQHEAAGVLVWLEACHIASVIL